MRVPCFALNFLLVPLHSIINGLVEKQKIHGTCNKDRADHLPVLLLPLSPVFYHLLSELKHWAQSFLHPRDVALPVCDHHLVLLAVRVQWFFAGVWIRWDLFAEVQKIAL